ncbi:MAG: DUF2961 domain-containing protein [Sedimentisphaerales bacterium]|nr:DUF2961 domain-containing protein [Sedimentisphaerales bacterium]
MGIKSEIKVLVCVLISLFLAAGSLLYADSYSYPQLVEKMYDLEALSVLPEEGEQGLQWTSYDRRSYYDTQSGKYIGWDANGDGDSYIRVEGDRIVMAEIDGPGCIWRIWAATAGRGKVTIILDGQKTVDMPFEDYFSGKVAPFNRDQIVHIVANGKNNYTPIPFQKSCKILADKDYGRYFIFGYSKFPEGTKVPTFSMDMSDQDSKALDEANTILKNTKQKDHAGEKILKKTIVLEPGQAADVFNEKGKYAISQFVCEPKNLPSDVQAQRNLLRSIDLYMYWDGEGEASAWSPLGDFFGTGPGINEYASYPMGTSNGRFYSNWYMPFAKSGKISIENQNENAVELDFIIKYAPLNGDAKKYSRFHAKWHRDVFPLKDERGAIDWTLLKVKGRGRYVGTQLQIWNPRGGWWGEGDEKFYIDGEKFPSLFGTGSEDYIGYAWSSYELFEHPYHNQTISEDGMGHVSVNRWHIPDNIPFQESFDGYIEKYFSNMRPTQFAAVVYWYADKNSEDPLKPVALKDRLDYYKGVMFPLMCNGLIVIEKPAGVITEQGMAYFAPGKWTEDKQLWWEAKKPDTVLRLGFNVPKDGVYRLSTKLTKAVDYGNVQLYVNDEAVGDVYDCYQAEGVGITDEIDLGTVEIREGLNILKVKMVGKNPEAYGRYMFGMDYLKAVEVD